MFSEIHLQNVCTLKNAAHHKYLQICNHYLFKKDSLLTTPNLLLKTGSWCNSCPSDKASFVLFPEKAMVFSINGVRQEIIFF